MATNDALLQNIMMESARQDVEASVTIPTDTPEGRRLADAIQDGSIHAVSVGQPAEPDLSGLFMNREAQDAAEALGLAHLPPHELSPGPAMPITFDDEPAEGTTVPNERVRFQVGRESPPPTTFRRETFSGPSEGAVVSRRGADGRFQAIPRPPEPRPEPVPIQAVNVRPPAPAAPQPPPPTRWERLSGPDPFDD
jgi:hypothetical protein